MTATEEAQAAVVESGLPTARSGWLHGRPWAAVGLLTAIAASYTMAREREIHARILGGALPAAEAAPASGGTDDIFF